MNTNLFFVLATIVAVVGIEVSCQYKVHKSPIALVVKTISIVWKRILYRFLQWVLSHKMVSLILVLASTAVLLWLLELKPEAVGVAAYTICAIWATSEYAKNKSYGDENAGCMLGAMVSAIGPLIGILAAVLFDIWLHL